METIEQTINGSQTAHGNGTVTISRNGDLVTKVYVTATMTTASEDGAALINNVEVEIGGQRIDKQTSEWNQIWADLSTPESKADGFKCMTGGCGVTGTKGVVGEVQVPLNFWFCRNPGLALPLIALQYHEVKLKCAWGATVGNRKVLCDYIYLDTDERRRFAQVSHEYLIEQIQSQSADGTGSFKLNFNHPVKELIWTSRKDADYTSAQLKLNGHDRFSSQQEEYFQLRQPFDYHTAIPGQNIVLNSRPQMLATPLDCGITSHNAASQAGAVAVNVGTTRITYAANPNASEVTAINSTWKIGDIFVISVANSSTATTVTGGLVHSVTGFTPSADSTAAVVTFTPALGGFPADADAMKVSIIARCQSPVSRTGQLESKINVYSFALKPEEHQPSGTCNFSRIDTAKLDISDTSGMTTDDTIYAVNYNVLRIMSGMGGLAYSN